MTKLRFLKNVPFGPKTYVSEGNISEISKVLRAKLNMVKIGANYGNHKTCIMCQEVSETTEHLLECDMIRDRIQKYTGKQIQECEKLKDALEMSTGLLRQRSNL